METLGSKRKTRGGGGSSGQVGFRFHPTGEELVDHYLKLKKQDQDFKAENIPEIDVCDFDPGDLAALMPSDDMEWYFFGRKDYKYKNSKRSNRTTPGGNWKITGKERVIKARRSKAVIGKKRTLTFYRRCEPKPKKTNWVMHEHYLIDSEANPKLPQKDFVICRMKKKSDEEDTSICEVELGSCSVSNVEDHAAAVVTPGSQDNSSSTLLSSGYIELEDVLQANGTNDDCNVIQSPFGDNNCSYTNKNDISTCDEGEPHSFTVSDFENETPHDMSQELCAQSQKDMDSLWLHVAQESPTYVISKNNVSTSNDDEKFKNTVSNSENQATNKRISEAATRILKSTMPIVLSGDWNGSKRGHVFKFRRSQGFESTYDTAHQYTDADAHKWVSHRNHRGNICGVDFIWLCNPIKSRKPLKTSWCEAVFGILRLRKAWMAENDALAFLKGDGHGDFITSSAICEALQQVNLIGHPRGLGFQETRDLWIQADADANGVLDYKEFKNRILGSTASEDKESLNGSREESKRGMQDALGFNVKNAVLYPREAEKGYGPKIILSDHAPLSVVLSPERMWCCKS